MNLLIVYFYETTSNKMLFLSFAACECNDLCECSWNNTPCILIIIWSHHCMSFSTAGLPISEDCSIISFKHIVNKRKSSLLINIALKRILTKYLIESKRFWSIFGSWFEQIYLLLLSIHVDNTLTVWFNELWYLTLFISDS